MENMDLYSLPKDMLVKLVSTIKEDVSKDYEEKIKTLEEKLALYDSIELLSCIFCEKTYPENDIVYHVDEANIYICKFCHK